MKLSNLISCIVIVLATGLSLLTISQSASAQGTSDLTISLDSSTISVTPGGTAVFTGNIANSIYTDSGETLLTYFDDVNFAAADATIDDSPYFNNDFGLTLDSTGPTSTTGDTGLFNIDVSNSATVGEQFTGTFAVDYFDSNSDDVSGITGDNYNGNPYAADLVNFTVDVVAPVTSTPEPSQLSLLLIGITMLGGLTLWRKREVHV